jgi:hypothetical protein
LIELNTITGILDDGYEVENNGADAIIPLEALEDIDYIKVMQALNVIPK